MEMRWNLACNYDALVKTSAIFCFSHFIAFELCNVTLFIVYLSNVCSSIFNKM